MRLIRSVFPLLAGALLLSGCGGTAPSGAVVAADRLLDAARAGDRAAFEAGIDRAAVREDVRRQLVDAARASALEVDGGPSEFALDRMISPQAVRRVVAEAQAETDLKGHMRTLGAARACLGEAQVGGDCLLTFARGDGGWRLVGLRARDLGVELAVSRP
jgi:hypothetical protein